MVIEYYTYHNESAFKKNYKKKSYFNLYKLLRYFFLHLGLRHPLNYLHPPPHGQYPYGPMGLGPAAHLEAL